jgi:hypothetical protein
MRSEKLGIAVSAFGGRFEIICRKEEVRSEE